MWSVALIAAILLLLPIGAAQANAINGAGGATAGGVGPIAGNHYGPKARKVFRACRHYKVSFWIMWGIAGAESGWGSGGSNLFGLLDGAGGVDIGSWKYASLQATKLMRSLHDETGSWEGAMLHYSGYNYGLSHVRYMYAQQKPTI